jgi:2-polyprenyl-6-methoxyphenol hydroxylase-like FAD-dependent oxidoreductase
MHSVENVLIVGAGMCGMSLGVALRRAGINCEIVEIRPNGAGDRDIASRTGFTGIADCGRAGSMHLARLRLFLFQGLRRDG